MDELIAFAEKPVFLQGKMGFGKHAELTFPQVLEKDRGYLQWMAKQGVGAWDRDVYFTVTELLNGRRHEDCSHTA